MIQRQQYLEKLKKVQNKQLIKVITGVRRCGKSTLLMQFREYLKENGVDDTQIIAINFEDLSYSHLDDYMKLYNYINEQLVKDKKTYVFLDEIQTILDFQKAVDSLFIKDNVDVYITGSNAYLLSGELATLLSGRYIEIQMLPFSFAEYYQEVGGDRRDAWNRYFVNGGFPYLTQIEEEDIQKDYLTGLYSTVLLKDVVTRNKVKDTPLLESVVKFLFGNIGSIVSSKKVADRLISFGRKTTSITVENYIYALVDAFVLYKAGRYDIKGKQNLKSLEKYYLVDIGLRKLFFDNKNKDIGHILENIVYLELIRRGYDVCIGKVGTLEVDFIASSGGDKIYYQVAASVLDPTTFAREIAPFKKMNDHYPKFIISMDEIPMEEDGIRQINVVDFLLSEKLY